MSTKELCKACGNELQTVYYQRRAADEPQDKVVFCPLCPLDTSLLTADILYRKVGPRYGSIKINAYGDSDIHSASVHVHDNCLDGTKNICILRIRGAAAGRCMRMQQDIGATKSMYCQTPVYYIHGNTRRMVQYDSGSRIIDGAWISVKSRTIAPKTVLEYVTVLTSNCRYLQDGECIGGYEYQLDNMDGSSACVLRTVGNTNYAEIMVLLNSAANTVEQEIYVLDIIGRLLQLFGTEDTLYSIIPPTTISLLYIRSARSYDWANPPTDGFVYSWKPDGERHWCVRYGCMWLFVRKLLSARISGWVICNTIHCPVTVGAILDVELMICHSPILLDVLCDKDGTPTPTTRSVSSVIKEFRRISMDGLKIVVKEYYRTMQGLKCTLPSIDYPIDGAVGSQDGSTDIIKLKDIRSIELRLTDTGNLETSDGYLVASSELHCIYDPGSILELRVVNNSALDKLMVTEIILRTDKTKANDNSACVDIINALGEAPDSLSRRKALEWCNSVRRRMYTIAAGIRDKGRIILDIGSGDGQAVSDYSTDESITYLLIEPNVDKCSKLYRRLSSEHSIRCRLYSGVDSMLKIINLLSTGSLKYAIVCATLGQVMSVDQVAKSMKIHVRCCVASFSLSYVSSTLKELALSGIDIISCGYAYDGISEGNYLVNSSGVTMRYIGERLCSVKWGGDRSYKEPVMYRSDFGKIMFIRPATDLVPLHSDLSQELLAQLHSSLIVVSTIKYL